MPAPRRLRIVQAIGARVATVGQPVQYNRLQPHLAELPLFLVYDLGREAEERNGAKTRCAMNVAVVGYRQLTDQHEIVGNAILADIAQAVELADKSLGGLLMPQDGLTFVTESIYMPEAGESIVAAEIVYSCPHVRTDGNPEIQ